MFNVTFIVKVSSPVHHPSTDAVIGWRSTIVEAFGTYEEALAYACKQDDHDWDNRYSIDFDVTWEAPDGSATYGLTRPMHELMTVKSHYSGPDPFAGIF